MSTWYRVVIAGAILCLLPVIGFCVPIVIGYISGFDGFSLLASIVLGSLGLILGIAASATFLILTAHHLR